MEEWRDIRGYEGLYQISRNGVVRGLTSNRPVKPYQNNNGYLKVDLYKGCKREHRYVHRLVADAYIKNVSNKSEVNHKDEDKTNNCVENLEYCDHSYNMNHGTVRQRISEKLSKGVFCNELNRSFRSISEASRETGICLQSISLCCLGKQSTAGKLHWRFE